MDDQSDTTSEAVSEALRDAARPFRCEVCRWSGKKGQTSERNGCAACPRCGRFAYPDLTRLEKS